MTQQAALKKPLNHRVTDAVVAICLCLVPVSLLVELISNIFDFAYPFMDVLGYLFYAVMLATVISPVYSMKSSSAAKNQPNSSPFPRQGQSAVITTWQGAEASARDFMRANGHPDARLTPPGPDGGVDVVAAGAIAQVKFYAKPVGAPAVVQLAGTTMTRQYRGRQALFFASSGFTRQALVSARDLGVALYALRGGSHWVRVH